MKKIKLPFSYTIDVQRLDDGIRYGSKVLHPEIEDINHNRLQIINAGNELEKSFNSIILHYFFGNEIYKTLRRNEFESLVLGKSWMSLNAKKNLIIDIMNDLNVPKGENKEKFQKSLRRFIDSRNLFAHGHITVAGNLEFELGYYHGEPNAKILNDDFFSALEKDVEQCFNYTKEIGDHLKVGNLTWYNDK